MKPHHAGEGADPLLRLRSVSKAFPGVVANDHVDLDVAAGQVHALVGENGAGKSTLLSILYGLQRPDTGSVELRGAPVTFAGPRDAIHAGIGLVQQHFSLIPTLTVADNVALALRSAGRRVSRTAAAQRVRELGERLDMRVDPAARIADLPVASQQRAEVIKALAHDVEVLALDEPNALLTPDEWDQLAGVLTSLADEGVGVLLVSHKLREVLDVAAHVTVLRHGRVVMSRPAVALSEEEVGEAMIGRRLSQASQPDRTASGRSAAAVRSATPAGEPRLVVKDLHVADDRGALVARGIDFTVYAGEIVGLAGVEGSGQVELTEAIAGVRPIRSGRVLHGGRDVTAASVRDRQRAGIAFIPADRHRRGIVPTAPVTDNLLLPHLGDPALARYGWLRREPLRRRARELMREYDIRAPEPATLLEALSGGNQQKVVLARELSRGPRTLVACYPTRGLDFGATDFVRRRIAAQRDRDAAVLFASVDLDELLGWTDRIVVLHAGRVVGELVASEADARRLGLLMGGTAVPT